MLVVKKESDTSNCLKNKEERETKRTAKQQAVVYRQEIVWVTTRKLLTTAICKLIF